MIKYFLATILFISPLSVYAEGVARLVVSHTQFEQISRALSSMCDGGGRTYVRDPSLAGVGIIEVVVGSNAEIIDASHQVATWCRRNFRGTQVNVVSLFVGADLGAVGFSVGNQRPLFIDVDARTGEAKGMSPATADGGFVDFDLPAFDFDVLQNYGLSTYPQANYVSYATVYGVVVSGKLYVDLQKAQGLVGCGVSDISLACQPSVSRAVYAAILSEAFNTAKQDVNVSLGVGVAGDKLTLCRFNRNFGSERAADEYFLRSASGSDGYLGGAIQSADAETYASENSGLSSFAVVEVDTKKSFDTCVKGGGAYAIGVMSVQNVPPSIYGSSGGDNVWRYVKLNSVEVFEASTFNVRSALEGRYDFWFYGSKFSANLRGESIVNAIDAQVSSRGSSPGIFSSGRIFDRPNNFSPVLQN